MAFRAPTSVGEVRNTGVRCRVLGLRETPFPLSVWMAGLLPPYREGPYVLRVLGV